jgi:hypothetical protein
VASFIVYVWNARRTRSVLVASVDEQETVTALKAWCESRGWEVEISEPRNGPEHK